MYLASRVAQARDTNDSKRLSGGDVFKVLLVHTDDDREPDKQHELQQHHLVHSTQSQLSLSLLGAELDSMDQQLQQHDSPLDSTPSEPRTNITTMQEAQLDNSLGIPTTRALTAAAAATAGSAAAADGDSTAVMVEGLVEDHEDGTYTVTYTADKAGKYMLFITAGRNWHAQYAHACQSKG